MEEERLKFSTLSHQRSAARVGAGTRALFFFVLRVEAGSGKMWVFESSEHCLMVIACGEVMECKGCRKKWTFSPHLIHQRHRNNKKKEWNYSYWSWGHFISVLYNDDSDTMQREDIHDLIEVQHTFSWSYTSTTETRGREKIEITLIEVQNTLSPFYTSTTETRGRKKIDKTLIAVEDTFSPSYTINCWETR